MELKVAIKLPVPFGLHRTNSLFWGHQIVVRIENEARVANKKASFHFINIIVGSWNASAISRRQVIALLDEGSIVAGLVVINKWV